MDQDEMQQQIAQQQEEYSQTLMRNFQMELGRLSGQSIVDRTQFETQRKEWEQREQQYQHAIEALNQRIVALESSFPHESGTAQSAGEASEAEPVQEAGDPQVIDLPLAEANKKKRNKA